ncbi:MAG: RagB/SusD family nutrient uptake outer membrane protein [Flavobacteriia bacterium]|nr:RagB/SusD family nutrient uptake outer membrane protein [Flavobacteriia bacterium]
MKKIFYIIIFVLLTSCRKDWLEAKRDISVIVPTTLVDMRLLLNYHITTASDGRSISEFLADDYFLTTTYYNGRTDTERGLYLWNYENFKGTPFSVPDWDKSYEQILYANVILEGLRKIDRALVRRSRSFFALAGQFAKPYIEATASQELGIPLKLSPDINEPIIRATLQQTYDRITDDLKEAAGLLKPVPAYKTDSSRPAAYGLLARVYLSMGKYGDAYHYADLCLKETNTLLDYNTLNTTPAYPIPAWQNNPEIIMFGQVATLYGAFTFSNSNTPREIYDLYDEYDLRKKVFFVLNANNEYGFRGTYCSSTYHFTGIATDEMLLIRAECAARANDVDEAMRDLNTLLEKRFVSGKFQGYTAGDADEALRIVLTERRKELLRRGLRWSDLRRLNQDGRFQTTLKRTIDGQEYTLAPNSPSYTLPIPQYVIESSGIPQN